MKTYYGRLQQLSMSSFDWLVANPVLGEGEIGYDTTEKKIKIGDGSTKWSSLPFESTDSVDTSITCDDFAI